MGCVGQDQSESLCCQPLPVAPSARPHPRALQSVFRHTAVGPWVVRPSLKTPEWLSFALRITYNISDSLPRVLQALLDLDLAPAADCDLVCQWSGSFMPLQSLGHSCCS